MYSNVHVKCYSRLEPWNIKLFGPYIFALIIQYIFVGVVSHKDIIHSEQHQTSKDLQNLYLYDLYKCICLTIVLLCLFFGSNSTFDLVSYPRVLVGKKTLYCRSFWNYHTLIGSNIIDAHCLPNCIIASFSKRQQQIILQHHIQCSLRSSFLN